MKKVLGHIECPTCAGQMRVTPDKNGAPFGFCEDCGQQLRVGGSPMRVRQFVKRYPWAAEKPEPVQVEKPVTVPEEKPEPVQVEKPVTVTEEKPKKTASPWDAALRAMGVE